MAAAVTIPLNPVAPFPDLTELTNDPAKDHVNPSPAVPEKAGVLYSSNGSSSVTAMPSEIEESEGSLITYFLGAFGIAFASDLVFGHRNIVFLKAFQASVMVIEASCSLFTHYCPRLDQAEEVAPRLFSRMRQHRNLVLATASLALFTFLNFGQQLGYSPPNPISLMVVSVVGRFGGPMLFSEGAVLLMEGIALIKLQWKNLTTREVKEPKVSTKIVPLRSKIIEVEPKPGVVKVEVKLPTPPTKEAEKKEGLQIPAEVSKEIEGQKQPTEQVALASHVQEPLLPNLGDPVQPDAELEKESKKLQVAELVVPAAA